MENAVALDFAGRAVIVGDAAGAFGVARLLGYLYVSVFEQTLADTLVWVWHGYHAE